MDVGSSMCRPVGLQGARLGCAAAGGAAALQAHAFFSEVDWAAALAMRAPAPHVPAPLDVADMDAALLELTTRCQSGFD